ncbi:MAG TPA: hypothetical protein VGP69_18235, partial [Gaiellaceae bacterium]|nr:hypothetical protein [Gaiellaceae bacterium]
MQETPASTPDTAVERRRIPALLAGYWSFGQYWGIWVILVIELQSTHRLSYGRMGAMLALLSVVAMLVMAFVAPRLARLPLGALCGIGLIALGTASLGMAFLPTAA